MRARFAPLFGLVVLAVVLPAAAGVAHHVRNCRGGLNPQAALPDLVRKHGAK